VESPRDHRTSDLDRTRIGRFPSLARFVARWSTWISQLRGRRARAMRSVSRPVDAHNSGGANSRHIEPPQAPLAAQSDAQTDRLADQPISLGSESAEVSRPGSPVPTTNAATTDAPDASSVLPLSSLFGVSAPVQNSKEDSQADQSAVPPANEAAPESREGAPSVTDHEAAPDRSIGVVGATVAVLPGTANVDELESFPAAGTPDPASQVLPTVPERAEVRSASTSAETAKAETSSLERQTPAFADNDSAPAVDTIDGAGNVDGLQSLPAAGTPDPANQVLPTETVQRAETQSSSTEAAEGETSSLKTPPPADNDAAPAVDTVEGAADPLSDVIGPEVSDGEDMLPVPDAAQPEALASSPRPISKYRPRLGPRSVTSLRPAAVQTEQEPTGGSLEAILLLTFLPGDWGISLAVLLGRADGMLENLEVRVGGTTYSLLTIDARLFEPFEPPGEVDIVGDGFAVEAATPPTRRWVRTKRDLHVFSERAGVSGFASVPRALIGQENVVLCRAHLAATAIDCARATGSAELQQVTGPGIPEGWQCFRAFRPKAPADFGEASDIFLSLNPLPDAAIELSGGIASKRSTWIVGAPPTIRILGTDPSAAEFTIDGHPASPAHGDGWLAPGWDAPGTHTIRFGGLSRAYEIVEIDETWPTWATDSASAYFVCGARVSASAQPGAFAFAGGPRWLLGACPGDVAFAAQSSAGIAIAAPPFHPVWALAARTGGRLLPAAALPFRAPPQMPSGPVAREQIAQWCNLLRESSAPTEANSKELWRQYRQLARRLKRRRR
jgi:hypothetical protein